MGQCALRNLACAVALAALVSAPRAAMAQDEEAPRVVVDARLEGLTANGEAVVDVTTNLKGGNALTWFLFVLLSAMAAGVMFKDARRSHLD